LGWGEGNQFVAIALILFAFSTIIANYSFAETNLHYLIPNNLGLQNAAVWGLRLITGVMILAGVYADLTVVWTAADVAATLMAFVNLSALLMLAPVALRVIRDYTTQLKTTDNPKYDPTGDAELLPLLEPDIWPAAQAVQR
jgi:AGCS family alanine or glycine:cation symporter